MKSCNAESDMQIKHLDTIVDDNTEAFLCAPLGTHNNKALMSNFGCLSGGPSELPTAMCSQLDCLVTQVKNLTGAGLGGRPVDVMIRLSARARQIFPGSSLATSQSW